MKQEFLEAEIHELREQLATATQVTGEVSTRFRQDTSESHELVDERGGGGEDTLSEVSKTTQTREQSGTSESSESDNVHTDLENSQQSPSSHRTQVQKKDPHLPGFRTLIQRVDKFSG